jgi:hypothetical protein
METMEKIGTGTNLLIEASKEVNGSIRLIQEGDGGEALALVFATTSSETARLVRDFLVHLDETNPNLQ